MSEARYLISEAARMAEVDAHVLRYWEEELELPIARNKMGHRYYTRQDIQIFQDIKGSAAARYQRCDSSSDGGGGYSRNTAGRQPDGRGEKRV